MTRRLTVRNTVVSVLTVATMVAGAGLFNSRAARAVSDERLKVLFGPVGLTRVDVLRVNVYGIIDPNQIGDPNEIGDPNLLWQFEVKIFDATGRLAKTSRLGPVAPGATAFSDFAISDEEYLPPRDRFGRRTYRVEIVGFNPQPDPPGAYAASLELFDRTTGLTRLVLGGPDTVPVGLPAVQ
jgi:hypothetical protein